MKSKSIGKTSGLISLLLTVILWALLVIAGYFVKIESPVKNYVEIQIQLDDVIPVEKISFDENKEINEESEIIQEIDELDRNAEDALSSEAAEDVNTEEIMESVDLPETQPEPAAEALDLPEQMPEMVPEQMPEVIEKVPVKAPEPMPVIEPEPAAVKEQMPVNQTEEIKAPPPVPEKTAEVKTEPLSAKKEPVMEKVEVRKTVEELAAEAQSRKKEKKEVDFASIFGDEDFEEDVKKPAVQKKAEKVPEKNALVGKAALSADEKNQDAVKSVSTNDKKAAEKNEKDNQTAKNKNLLDVKNASVSSVGKASENERPVDDKLNEVKNSSVPFVNSNGKNVLKMDDGSARELIFPEKPAISISRDNSKQLSGSITVQVEFTVLQNGTVPVSGINISPASVLPAAIQNEIKNQICKWMFEKSNSNGQAKFDYSIIIQ